MNNYKWYLVTIVGIIVVPLLVNGIMFMPSLWSVRGSHSDWISFFGNISGGIIGALVALFIARNEINMQKNNEEENRKINQMHGLIRVKFELNKIIKNFKMLEYIKVKFPINELDYDYHLYKHEIDPLNDEYWSSLNLDDIELELNLLDLKDFYEKFRRSLALDISEVKIKIQDENIKLHEIELSSLEPFDFMVKQKEIKQNIMELESEIGNMEHLKKLQWDTYYIRNFYEKSIELLSELDNNILQIENLKESRKFKK